MRGRLLTGGAFALTSGIIVGALAVPRLRGQASTTSTPTRPSFEVASIKPAAAAERGGGQAGLQPGGRFVMTNGPARVLINMAFRTLTGEMSGAPDWVTYENFDVEARAGRDLSYEQLAPLMRDLLADRFKLITHVETRTRPMYELRVARAGGVLGPAMRQSTADCESRPASCMPRAGTGLIDSNSMSMAESS